jgi:hypothetical protein
VHRLLGVPAATGRQVETDRRDEENVMAHDDPRMIEAISRFAEASERLREAEANLGTLVDQAIKTCKGVDDLQVLVDALPERYRGRRKIFEAILRAAPDPGETQKTDLKTNGKDRNARV